MSDEDGREGGLEETIRLPPRFCCWLVLAVDRPSGIVIHTHYSPPIALSFLNFSSTQREGEVIHASVLLPAGGVIASV